MLPNSNTQPIAATECLGFYPLDLVIRSALLEGISQLRSQPWLLDFLFQGLLRDPYIARHYGTEEFLRSKEWILNTNIVVAMAHNLNQGSVPHVTIFLGSESEAEATLGDVHYINSEQVLVPQLMSKNSVLTFTPSAFDAATGTITLLAPATTDPVWQGMRILDRANNRYYTVLEVTSDTEFTIDSEPLSPPNLTNAVLLRSEDLLVAQLESVFYKQTVHLDLTVEGDATKLLVLHQLILYILHRYKQELLEARGFERTTVSANDVASTKFGAGAAQRFFNRMISVTGYVKQIWPKRIEPAFEAVQPELYAIGAVEPDALAGVIDVQGWSTAE